MPLWGELSELPKTSLQNSKGLYEHLFDSSPDILLIIDQDEIIEVANVSSEEVLQIPPEDLRGQSVSGLLDSSNTSDFALLLTGMAEGTDMPEVEVHARIESGPRLPMMLYIRQIEGSKDAFLVRLRDLHEIKALGQEYRGLF